MSNTTDSTDTLDRFADPENLKEVLMELKKVSSEKEEKEFTLKYLPGWLVRSYDKYCEDYPRLDENWTSICEKVKQTKKSIVAVTSIPVDEDHLLIHLLCERFTRLGYTVRRDSELIPCSVCDAAIPSRDTWKHMKRMSLDVPNKWSDQCSTCQQ